MRSSKVRVDVLADSVLFAIGAVALARCGATSKEPQSGIEPAVETVRTSSAVDSGSTVEANLVTAFPVPDFTYAQYSVPQEKAPIDAVLTIGSREQPGPVPLLSPTDGANDAPEHYPQEENLSQVVDEVGLDKKASTELADTVKGQQYSWEDGDRTLTVHLQEDLFLHKDVNDSLGKIVGVSKGSVSVVRSETGERKAMISRSFAQSRAR